MIPHGWRYPQGAPTSGVLNPGQPDLGPGTGFPGFGYVGHDFAGNPDEHKRSLMGSATFTFEETCRGYRVLTDMTPEMGSAGGIYTQKMEK